MNTHVNIKVDSIEEITDFMHTIATFKGEAKLIKGKYKCDAKSLMGLLAIDTSEPTTLEFDIQDREVLLPMIEKFIVK